jgi:hypothetical protein
LPQAPDLKGKAENVDTSKLQKERDQLNRRIDNMMREAEDNDDARNRQDCLKRVSTLRDELEAVEKQLDEASTVASESTHDAWLAYWAEFDKIAVSVEVPTERNMALCGGLHQDPHPSVETSAIRFDPRAIREFLHDSGCRFELSRKTGKARWRMGQQSGTTHDLTSLRWQSQRRRWNEMRSTTT